MSDDGPNICMVPNCSARIPAEHAFCRLCTRVISEDEGWGLRMAARSPCFNPKDSEAAAESRQQLWGQIDGSEEMKIHFGEHPPHWHRKRGHLVITEILSRLEYEMALQAVANLVAKRRTLKAARERLREQQAKIRARMRR